MFPEALRSRRRTGRGGKEKRKTSKAKRGEGGGEEEGRRRRGRHCRRAPPPSQHLRLLGGARASSSLVPAFIAFSLSECSNIPPKSLHFTPFFLQRRRVFIARVYIAYGKRKKFVCLLQTQKIVCVGAYMRVHVHVRVHVRVSVYIHARTSVSGCAYKVGTPYHSTKPRS